LDTSSSTRTRLLQIAPEAFVSETDRLALQNLQKLPLLPLLIRKFNEYAVDNLFYVTNSAESVRCGPNQYRTLHDLLREACAVLDVPEPELYVHYSPYQNAYTAGVQRPFIVLQSALIDSHTDEELLFILGHELGHIKCGHVLYQMLAFFLLPLLEELGRVTMGVGRLAGMGLVLGFFEWLRQAEFTADRAGLLVCQDRDVAFRSLVKLGAGGSRLDHELNIEAFLEQARQHSEGQGLQAAAKVLLFLLYNRYLTHPQIVYRGKGLDEWIGAGAYERILGGDYPREQPKPEPSPAPAPAAMEPAPEPVLTPVWCAKCGRELAAAMKFCPECGTRTGPQEEPV
jgi:Zn-dependent protease with chaperone function